MKSKMALGDFLVAYLKRAGVDHIFGLPGDLVLSLFHRFGEAVAFAYRVQDEKITDGRRHTIPHAIEIRGTDEMAAVGHGTVNLTHRLQAEAQGGEVVMSEEACQHLPSKPICARTFVAHLKGVQEPMNLCVVEKSAEG